MGDEGAFVQAQVNGIGLDWRRMDKVLKKQVVEDGIWKMMKQSLKR